MAAFSAAMWKTMFVSHTGLRMIYSGRKVYRKIQIEPSSGLSDRFDASYKYIKYIK